MKQQTTGLQNDEYEKRSSMTFASLDMVATGTFPKTIGKILCVVFLISTLILMFVPWRQFVVGNGEIIVFSPMLRPQNIEAQIPGRLLHWYVRDGQVVTRGQLIADLTDLDPRFLDNNLLQRLHEQRDALVLKRQAAQEQLVQLHNSQGASIPAASERLLQAKDRLYAARQSVKVAEQNVSTAKWQIDRVNTLYAKGLKSQRDQQIAELDNVRANTELQRAKSALEVVLKDNIIAALDYKRVQADTESSIQSVKQVIGSTNADIAKLSFDIQNLEDRIKQREIRAPMAGRVVRLLRVGTGETVSAGTVIAITVPQTEDRAAAILVRDYDAPLVDINDQVRLAISGWPSLQFVGWPSVAVGTFAGRVAVIDAVDDGRHFYRIIVVPDKEAMSQKHEQPWPSPNRLRPGAKATGWVLLRYVPLWYELWRQFNGFQPTVPTPQGEIGKVKQEPSQP